MLCLLAAASAICAQSRHNSKGLDLEGTVINVIASRADGSSEPIKIDELFLYENGVEQKIKNFAYDPSPSRIVILADNSQTVPASVDKLRAAVMEFAYEIFDGDELFVLAYDEKAEIIQEWTGDAKKLENSLSTFRKKGNPNLFDALNSALDEVLLPLMPGNRKTAIVMIGDGLDRGSRTKFDDILGKLQNNNVTVYGLQVPDRTGGAYKRNKPKATAVFKKLVEGTGGRTFPLDSAQEAAKAICDELRRNRYLLSYVPVNTSTYDARSVFLTANGGITIRTKNAQPPNVK